MAGGDGDTASYDSSSSASSEDKVLISKKQRKKLQLKQRERDHKSDEAATKASSVPSTPLPSSKSPSAAAKTDLICGVCEKEGDDLYVCTGSCMGAFHLACLPAGASTKAATSAQSRGEWKCDSCATNSHICFHCKQLGTANSDTSTTATASESEGKDDATLRAVVKCRALSCGKYYHQDCIAKLPLARIAGARFICPLHTCSTCEQSGGAKKEPVRCMRCPVAYHSNCLPEQGVGVVHLPGSRIICAKHEAEREEMTAKQAPDLKRVQSVDDGDAVVSTAASSPRTEENDDAQSDASVVQDKKSSKKEKKDKKKKKKKRKKEKKKEKERHRGGEEDEESSSHHKRSKSTGTPRVKAERVEEEEEEAAEKQAKEGEETEEIQEEQAVPVAPKAEPPTDADVKQEEVASTAAEEEGEEAEDDSHQQHTEEKLAAAVDTEPLTVTVPDATVEEDDEEAEDSTTVTPTVSTAAATPAGAGSASDDQVEEKMPGDASTVEPLKERQSSSGSRAKKSKKKKKGKSGEGGEDAQPRADEAKWVQCDDCKKWRIVPKEVDLDAMPEKWYCTMNTWSKALASCAVPEEVVEAKKDRPAKRASSGDGTASAAPAAKKLKSKHGDATPVDGVARPGDGGSTVDKDKSAGKVAAVKKGEKDSKKRKLKLKLKEKYGEVKWVQCEDVHCGKWRVVPLSIDFDLLPSVWYCHLNTWSPELASCNAVNPPDVEAYLSKSQSKKRPAKKLKGPDAGEVAYPVLTGTPPVSSALEAKSKPSKSKTSTPTAAHVVGPASVAVGATGSTAAGTIAAAGSASSYATAVDARKPLVAIGVKSVVLEWAQCEKCNKWRKLPAHIKSSTLPDKWYCVMNHWDPSRASCAMPQEEDQEPVDASPLPSSQNWYPMPGQVPSSSSSIGGGGGGGGGGVRAKRGKLSYSELLYASTGQLRKTYTSESSTLSFEYEGTVYHRDDQYKRSSLYLSPLTTNKLTGEPLETDRPRLLLPAAAAAMNPAQQRESEAVSALILSKVDLRREYAITEIVDAVLAESERELPLSAITTALAQLVGTGVVEKVERSHTGGGGEERGSTSTATELLRSLSSQQAYYRRVPKRPLKALKAWKLECH